MEDNKAILERRAFERFASKYWGQSVGRKNVLPGVPIAIHVSSIMNVDYLQLRSIDSLTDEELIKVCSLTKTFKDLCIKEYFTGTQIDYLRSIGILVTADGYTVEEILEMGWAKIN